jgi:hypothetical protein
MPAVSGQTAPVAAVDTAPSGTVQSWTLHGRSVAALAATRGGADGALGCSDGQQPRPRCPCWPPRSAASDPVSALPRGVHLDRGPVSTRTGVRSLLAVRCAHATIAAPLDWARLLPCRNQVRQPRQEGGWDGNLATGPGAGLAV